MKFFLSGKRTLLVISLIGLCILAFTLWISCTNHKSAVITSPEGQQYAGSEACRNCHKPIYDSFIHTAHYLTSRIASKKYIRGSFAEGHNTFAFTDRMKVVMTEKEGRLFQTAWLNGKPERTESFDIVMGSGKKGQTYLYWKGKQLFQLPISYFTNLNDWANSPGFSPDNISFERNIQVRCMECHTTFAKRLIASSYDPDQILYGVDCERCHGPGARHVEFERQHLKGAPAIINPASLSRQQNLDVCAVCHSGVMRSIAPAFSFLPGDTLSNYFVANSSHIDTANLDVHANQYGLLTASKCFRISGTMTCATCHNTHEKEKDLHSYSQKCMTCHTQTHTACTLQAPPGFSLEANCIDCHMPVQASRNLTLLLAGHKRPSPELVRSHLIASYPIVTKEILKMNATKN